MQLPKYWLRKGIAPYGTHIPDVSNHQHPENILVVSRMAVYERHRSILFNSELKIIFTLEKRYARLLLIEALEMKWIKDFNENVLTEILLPKTYKDYPGSCQIMIYFNALLCTKNTISLLPI